MKINVARQLKQFNMEPLCHPDGSPALVRDFLLIAVNQPVDNQTKAMQMYRLGVQVAMCDEVEISAVEIVDIENILARVVIPLVSGQIIDLLEGRVEEMQDKEKSKSDIDF